MRTDAYAYGMLLLLALWVGATLYFAWRNRQKTSSLSDYALGSLAFSPYAVGLSLAASMTSAATFIINPGLIGLYGFSGVISYGFVLPLSALLALVVLTKSFRKYGRATKALTLAQWMQNRYQNKALGHWFAWTALLLIAFIVLILVGLTQVIAASTSIAYPIVLVFLVIFVFGYTLMGGANTMVYTNALQALLMLVVAILLLGSGWEFIKNGFGFFKQELAAIDPKLVEVPRPDSFLFRDFWEIIGAQVVVGFAVVCQPHIITKSLLLKSESDVNRFLGTALSVQSVFFLVVIAGLFARLTFPDLTQNGEAIKPDSLMSVYVVNHFTPVVGLLVLMGLLAAGISTLEGLIQSLSTTITLDIIGAYWPSVKDGQNGMRVNKGVVAVLGLVSGALALQQLYKPSVSVAIFAQNGVYAYFAAAVIPVLIGLFLPKHSPKWILIIPILAIAVHFAVYYLRLGFYMQTQVRNPAIPAAWAIVLALGLAVLLFLVKRPGPKNSTPK